MNTQLKILIVASRYAETVKLTSLLREMRHDFTLITDPHHIEPLVQRTDFDALFLPLPSLREAAPPCLMELKRLPARVPVFFIAEDHSDLSCYECVGIRAVDTVLNGANLKPAIARCLRIAGHMRPDPFAAPAGGNDQWLKPLYAQLSNVRMLNQLMREETSRERLIKNTCHNIAQVAGYQQVWINLQQKHGGYQTHSGAADVDAQTGALLTRMPSCVNLSNLHLPQIIANYEDCNDCPFYRYRQTHACLYYPLKHKAEPVGELCALVHLPLVGNRDFMAMFKQMADDLACAISLLTDQKAQRTRHPVTPGARPVAQNYIRQLEQAEQRFQALFREMPRVAVQGYNRNREVIFWNKASELFYGYTEAEALGKKIEELIMPDGMIDFAVQAINDWEKRGIPIPAAECALKHKGGQLVPVFSSHTGFNNLNGDFEMYCLDINLTEIKQAHATAEQLSTFPSENPNPVMRLNGRGEILYANPASDRLLDLWGTGVGASIPAEALKHATDAIKSRQVGYHLIKCNDRTFSTAFTPVSHDHDTINIYALDVTDRENAFHALQKAKQAAEAANLAKNDFLAIMSHELRTPLNGIMGMAQLLELTRLSTEQQEEVQSIIASANTLLDVITDILDITAIERDQITLKTASFNLKAVLQQALDIVRPSARKKKLGLHFHYPLNQPVYFQGDKQHISQIMINLLSNAVKFTDRGSVTLGIKIRDGWITLSVTDTGTGIPADQLDHIFGKFTQIDTSSTRSHGGSGLGLHISKRLVERIGGQIAVTSKEGAGSCFTVTLPLQSSTINESSVPRNRDIRILLAEENRINQLGAKKMLKALGCEVDVANDGEQALSYAQLHHYDLILMDTQLPKMSGLDTARAIRQIDGSRGKVPVIALSAFSIHDDIVGPKSGLDACLSKPLKYEELQDLLKQFLTEPDARSRT